MTKGWDVDEIRLGGSVLQALNKWQESTGARIVVPIVRPWWAWPELNDEQEAANDAAIDKWIAEGGDFLFNRPVLPYPVSQFISLSFDRPSARDQKH